MFCFPHLHLLFFRTMWHTRFYVTWSQVYFLFFSFWYFNGTVTSRLRHIERLLACRFELMQKEKQWIKNKLYLQRMSETCDSSWPHSIRNILWFRINEADMRAKTECRAKNQFLPKNSFYAFAKSSLIFRIPRYIDGIMYETKQSKCKVQTIEYIIQTASVLCMYARSYDSSILHMTTTTKFVINQSERQF